MSAKVFISYSSFDVKDVEKLAQFIETTGHKCWYSERNIDRGKGDWMNQIMESLKRSDIVVLYLTQNALSSGEVKNEIANASSSGKSIIPIIMSTKITDSYSYLIRKYEWIDACNLDESSVKDILRKRLLENVNEVRNHFWEVLKSKSFGNFVFSVMERYYGKHFFTNINDKLFPVFCLKGPSIESCESIKDFDSLCDYASSKLYDFDISEHQTYTQNKWYSEYSTILEGKLRYPNRPGYMLDRITTDDSGCFDKLSVHVGTFAENVYSTHVLEYELYQAYLAFGQKDLNDSTIWNQLKDFLSIRNKIHQEVPDIYAPEFNSKMKNSLLSGKGRDSLLSVQMLVVIKSKRNKQYEVKIIQRSDNVVIKPGVWQFIPSGGFEILNDSDDNVYDDIELEENFSPGCAVFREYLEEFFNAPEFEGGGNGSIEERLLKDPAIIHIEKMLKEGTAELRFLGSVLDLAGLRHELSFALIIHDESYSETQFIANEESKKGAIYSIPIKDFNKKHSIWNNIHAPSAAMWHLFEQSDGFNSLTDN